MYVCICHALTEKKVEAAVAESGGCPRTTFRTLGFKPKCGKCVKVIVSKAKEAQREAAAALGETLDAVGDPIGEKIPA